MNLSDTQSKCPPNVVAQEMLETLEASKQAAERTVDMGVELDGEQAERNRYFLAQRLLRCILQADELPNAILPNVRQPATLMPHAIEYDDVVDAVTTEPIEVEQRRRRAQIWRELARDVVREEIETQPVMLSARRSRRSSSRKKYSILTPGSVASQHV